MTDRNVLLRDIGVNVVLPYATYLFLSSQDVPTVQALAAGAVFPVAAIIVGFVRERRVQALGMIVLVATAASILAALYFTSPFLALAKGSLFTGGLGLMMLASLLARRPLAFHLARLGGDDDDRQHAETLWETEARYRRLMRRITWVWAVALLCEASLRLMLIPVLPVALFLPISEAMWIGCCALMIAWSWRYGARQMELIEGGDDRSSGAVG
jgi:hypothetical protein